MLEISIALNAEGWDEEKQEFVPPIEETLQLEHSLVSISKWESKWKKPFLGRQPKTIEETVDYVKCMTLNEVDPKVYDCLTVKHIDKINKYIEDPMTATTFSHENGGGGSGEVTTSELIYYWMIALEIPPEYQFWHLNRLLTLVKICNIKNQPAKKMGRQETLARNTKLNAERRARMNSAG